LSSEDDPLGSQLMIDFFALKSEQYVWLLEFWKEKSESTKFWAQPNFLYSVALSKFFVEQSTKEKAGTSSDILLSDGFPSAAELLQNAVLRFPTVLLEIYRRSGMRIPDRLVSHPYFQKRPEPNILNTLIDLYVERNHFIWKEHDVIQWLEACIPTILNTIKGGSHPEISHTVKIKEQFFTAERLPRNVYRHIVIADIQSLNGHIPFELRSRIHLHDPLPPPGVLTTYTEFERGLQAHRTLQSSAIASDSNPMAAFLRSLIPWMNEVEDTGEMIGENAGTASVSNSDDSNRQGVLENALEMLPEHLRDQIRNFGLANFLNVARNELIAGQYQEGDTQNESESEWQELWHSADEGPHED